MESAVIKFLRTKDPHFSVVTDTNQSFSLQEWMNLMDEYCEWRQVTASVTAFMPTIEERYQQLSVRHEDLIESHKELRKVFLELVELAISAQKTPPCEFHTEKSKKEVARINEIARMVELYR